MVDENVDHENDGMTAQFVDLFSLSLPEMDVKNFQKVFFLEKQMSTIFLSTIKNDVEMFRTL